MFLKSVFGALQIATWRDRFVQAWRLASERRRNSASWSATLAVFLYACGGGGDEDSESLPAPDIEGTPDADELVGTNRSDTLSGLKGDDNIQGLAGPDTLDGGANVDTADYSFSDGAVSIDLSTVGADGYSTGSGGHALGDLLKNFENLRGSRFDDLLAGDDGPNRLEGGDGSDTASYESSPAAITLMLAVASEDGYATGSGGHAQGDELREIENLRGSQYDDLLGANLGSNSLDGGAGLDTVDYSASPEAVSVDLDPDADAAIVGVGGYAEGDRLQDVENLIGSDFGDVLAGGLEDNTLSGAGGDDSLSGGAGDDWLIGGAGGDTLVGGLDEDTADYGASDAGVTVNLADPGDAGQVGGEGGHAAGDRLEGIENLRGSEYDDRLGGDDSANRLSGGEGTDVLDYGASSAGVSLRLALADASGQVSGAGGHAAGDLVDGFEDIIGSRYDDRLGGDAVINRLDGGAGVDTADYSGSRGGVTLDLAEERILAVNLDQPGASVMASTVTDTGFHLVLSGTGGLTEILVTGAGFTSNLPGLEDAADVFNTIIRITATSTGVSLNLAGVRVTASLVDGVDVALVLFGAGFTASISTEASFSLDRAEAAVTGTGGHAEGDRLANMENLVGSSSADVLLGDAEVNQLEGGEGDDRLAGREGGDTLIGGAGSDTVDYGGSDAAVTVNLRVLDLSGYALGNGGHAGLDRLKEIENLQGSAFADRLFGDAQDNRLEGGVGADTLSGGEGADTLDGGRDLDTADYANSNLAVTLDLGTLDDEGQIRGAGGHAAGDLLVAVENLVGSDNADVLSGDGKDNILNGGLGNDTLAGGDGADTLDGGGDLDVANYGLSPAGVRIDLSAPGDDGYVTGVGGYAEGDLLRDIESIRGSAQADLLTGTAETVLLFGGAGNDTLHSDATGAVRLDGGGDDDVLVYSAAAAGVTLLLSVTDALGWATAMIGGSAVGRVKNIENLVGSEHADTLGGNSEVNALDGAAGMDTADYAGSGAGVHINLGATSGGWALGSGGNAELDRLKNIEHLAGSGHADVLSGDALDNVLQGRGGPDVLNGRDGSDTASYADSDASVTIDLATLDAQGFVLGFGGHAAGDRLQDIENLIGSQYNDFLRGDSGANVLAGGGGADTLIGSGSDTAHYGDSRAGVTVDLSSGGVITGTGGDAQGDRLSGIANLTGSDQDDSLVGDDDDNVLVGNAGADDLAGGAGNDTLIGGAGPDDLDGDGGLDVADYSMSPDAVQIDFSLVGRNAYTTGSGGHAEGDRLKGIEKLVGSDYGDTLVGVAVGSELRGGAGDDSLGGNVGVDVLDGGMGSDTADYSNSSAGVTLNLGVTDGNGLVTGTGGHAEGDLLRSMENLIGSDFADVLVGEAAANTLVGGGGSDTLVGGAGPDDLDGGSGEDWADYSRSPNAVRIDLSSPDGNGYVNGSGGHAEEDRLRDIENLLGSAHADVLTGDDNPNLLDGGRGDDTLVGGGGGDTLLGGAEADRGDTADYSSSASGTARTIDLLAIDADGYVTASDGTAIGDRLKGIENLVGGDGDDILSGDNIDNLLDGGQASDTLSGRGGNDTLIGGLGSDDLDGGDASDTADYSASPLGITLNLADTPDSEGYVSGSGGYAAGDRVRNIENLVGGARGDSLTGDDGSNVLAGGPGPDVLSGGAGADTLRGGVGADVLDGGADVDTADYGVSDAGVTIDLSSPDGDGYVTGTGADAEGDRLRGIANILGSRHADRFLASAVANEFDGRDGIDALDYSASDAAVTVELVSSGYAMGIGGYASLDKLKNIEDLIGSVHADILTGDDNPNLLDGGRGDDTLIGGDGDDSILGGRGADRIDGGNHGEDGDVLDYRSSPGNLIIDLLAGLAVGGDASGDSVINIENLLGGAGDDTFTGNADANLLDGGGGSDTLRGGDGDDELHGGAGGDILDGGAHIGGDVASYALSSAGVTIDLADDGSMGTGGHAAGDKLQNIEHLIGSAFADELYGSAGDNSLVGGADNDNLRGGGGDDSLVGGAGADELDGGEDTDLADYSASSRGVYVDLTNGFGAGGSADGDQLRNIENLIGGVGADTLLGDAADNELAGGAGDDRLVGGAGADTLSGDDNASGGDSADYSASDAAVTVNLVSGDYTSGSGGTAAGDRLKGIENLLGSKYADSLTGDHGANSLVGNDGDDILDGDADPNTDSPGADFLLGGAGNDRMIAGAGRDTFDGGADRDSVDFSRSTAAVTIDLAATDSEGYAPGSGGYAADDRLRSIERLVGSQHDDILTGSAADEYFEGHAGSDRLDGGAGRDAADYSGSDEAVSLDLSMGIGSGGHAEGDRLRNMEDLLGSRFADTLKGDDQDNVLRGGAGMDRLTGGGGRDAASYVDAAGGVTVDLAAGVGSRDVAEGDRLSEIENLIGSAHDDMLRGDEAGNELAGQDGADSLEGGPGSDYLDGGDGSDTAIYTQSFAAVTIDLGLGTASGGHAVGDRLESIEGLVGSRHADTLTGDAGNNLIAGEGGSDVINGGDGVDTASYRSSAAGVQIDLQVTDSNGYAVGIGGDAEGDLLRGIENLIGSAQDDILTGDAGDNTLDGGGGRDTLSGGGGFDTAVYRDFASRITVNLAADDSGFVIVTGGSSEEDRLRGIEAVIGSDGYGDKLSGSSGANALFGEGGDDTLQGGGGADTLDGGAGEDSADYIDSSSAVSVDFASPDTDGYFTGAGGHAAGDRLKGIEIVLGSAHDDYFKGGEQQDTFVGRAGSDTVDYGASGAAVIIRLTTTTDYVIGRGGAAAGDRLKDVENLVGSRFGDTLAGDADDNSLAGGAGADVLAGGAHGVGGDTLDYSASTLAVMVDLSLGAGSDYGIAVGGHADGDRHKGFENVVGGSGDDILMGDARNNTLIGGAGRDRIEGGDGSDTVDYRLSGASVTIDLMVRNANGYNIGTGGDASGDLLKDIENISGSAGNDVLMGSDVGNVLDGGAGDDTLAGGDGDDTLIGGAGDSGDDLAGGAGRDALDYSTSGEGVSVALSGAVPSVGTGGDAEGDRIRSIEHLIGSAHADLLQGDQNSNILDGRGGDDSLIAGVSSENSAFFGAAGRDTLSYDKLASSTASVTVNLTAPGAGAIVATVRDPLGNDPVVVRIDTLQGIENLIGSSGDDVISGDGEDNFLAGGPGEDTLRGAGGDDWLDGGGGEDMLDGGADRNGDTASYMLSGGGVSIDLGTRDSEGYALGIGGAARGDRLRDIEHLVGSLENNDVLTGDADANSLSGEGGNDSLSGAGADDVLKGGVGADVLDGGAHASMGDTADYGASGASVTVNLGATQDAGGYVTGRGGHAAGDTLRNTENLTGSPHPDVLTGNADGNLLRGGDGDDTLNGGAGGDTLIGAAGSGDSANYQDSDAGVVVDLSAVVTDSSSSDNGYVVGIGGHAEGDRLQGIENLMGSDVAAGDTLTGDAGDNSLHGGGGDDVLEGKAGADMLDGGAGMDTADYAGSNAGVMVSLDTGIGVGGHAEGDELEGIENLKGSDVNDTLTGNTGDNFLDGADGDDYLNGGAGGDSLVGGANTDFGDTVDYSDSDVGVVVVLGFMASGGDAEGDSLHGIENLIGSPRNDVVVGDSQANRLAGLLGADRIWGGDGMDTADYGASSAGVVIDLGAKNAVGVVTGRGGHAQGDELKDIENLVGSRHADTLAGDSVLSTLLGGDGDDTLIGTAGRDSLIGGGGSDTVDYSAADAGVTIALGALVVDPGRDDDGYAVGRGGHADGDRLKGIENIVGSIHDDRLTGNSATNILLGGSGADTLAGGEGSDDFIGGNGVDTVTYHEAVAGLTIDLTISGTEGYASGTGGQALGDRFKGIENLIAGSGADVLFGDAEDNLLIGGLGADILDGRGGVDTADYSASVAAVSINLSEPGLDGYVSGFGGHAEGDRLRAIERLIGTVEDDSLSGDDQDNLLQGGAGADTLDGGSSPDGGDGDTVDYSGSNAGVTVNLAAQPDEAGYVTGSGGHADGDLLRGIENLVGSEEPDRLLGNDNDNSLLGGGGVDNLQGADGDDYLSGGAGADTLAGGSGIDDSADYSASSGGVTIDLGDDDNFVDGEGVDGHAAGDRLKGIEHLLGSVYADRLGGNGSDNSLIGSAGADTLLGDPGADVLDGGEDTDMVDYGSSPAGISLDLAVLDADGYATGRGGYAEGDRLRSIEFLIGSRHGDTLVGDDENNRLAGGVGNDFLTGGDGDDYFQGGLGVDVMDGGLGAGDIVDYSDSPGAIDVRLNGNGFATGAGGHADEDRLKSIEELIGSSRDDILRGDFEANIFRGGRGGDTLLGDAGADTLIGQRGADIIQGGSGEDTADYGDSEDGVRIDLSRSAADDGYSTGIGGDAHGDRLKEIENIAGSQLQDVLQAATSVAGLLSGRDGDDTLIGGERADSLVGGAGDDSLAPGLGTDLLDGGEHVAGDVADYSGHDLAIAVDLEKAPDSRGFILITEGGVDGDRLRGIEGVRGSDNDDHLAGDGGANAFFGEGGADVLDGRGGSDTLQGGSGADTLTGGTDGDRFVYSDLTDSTPDLRDIITDFSGSMGDRVVFTADFDANQELLGTQLLTSASFLTSPDPILNTVAPFTAAGQLRYRVDGADLVLEVNADADFSSVEFSILFEKLSSFEVGYIEFA